MKMADDKTKQKVDKEGSKDESVEDQNPEENVIIIDDDTKLEVDKEETESLEKEDIKEEDEILREKEEDEVDRDTWQPKTEFGKRVKSGEIKDIDEILDIGGAILEEEIVEILLPNIETDLLMIGQSKGKFGGGQRRVFKQTQKKTREGNKPNFSTFAIAGNHDGYFGFGYGKAKETVPAREKAIRKAKLNIKKIRRGCGSWECGCGTPHSIPYQVEGKCGSIRIKLIPAPKGTGLVAEKECSKIIGLSGIKDIWVKTKGHTASKKNLLIACIDALSHLSKVRLQKRLADELKIVEGSADKGVANE
jgi:small subunit ribosomal protein S5